MAKAPAKSSKKKNFKKKEKKHVPMGVCHIQATFNNTIITFSDPMGNTLAELWLVGFPWFA
jgi:small subunit ribosomal protein S11